MITCLGRVGSCDRPIVGGSHAPLLTYAPPSTGNRRAQRNCLYWLAPSGDQEIEAEARAEGLDPDEVAEDVRGVLLAAVDRYQGKQRLERSRAEHQARVKEMRQREHQLPASPRQRQQLLALAFRARPQAAGMLTLQFRDLESLPDEDVTSCLRQLAELGVLDDLADD